MARAAAELPSGRRIKDFISLGVIARTFPIAKVREVLAETGKTSVWQRALPAHVMVHYVIALRGLMHEAALRANEDPDRLSFMHAIRVIRRKLPIFGAIPPSPVACAA